MDKFESIKAGDGVSVSFYSDVKACTVTKRTAKTITFQQDIATRLTQPEFVVGGFAGHCTNNNSIKYAFEANPNGQLYVARKCKDGHWRVTGVRTKLILGRVEHYDYNF